MISHAIGQCMARADKPIRSRDGGKLLEEGWINERVNMSDWEGEENIGSVFCGSCWSEVSDMLTYGEMPGVYVQPDTGFFYVLDHLDSTLVSMDDKQLTIKFTNPTGFDACYRLLSEKREDTRTCLGVIGILQYQNIVVAAKSEKVVNFLRS
jgi:hypothetical protein